MRLSDIMGHFGLAGYTEVATFIFLAVFVGAAIWAYLPSNRGRWASAGEMPLRDAPVSNFSNQQPNLSNQTANLNHATSESNEVL